jgi:hypothetical protein
MFCEFEFAIAAGTHVGVAIGGTTAAEADTAR